MYAALTEGEFVLRVYDLRRSLPVRPVDATCPHHAIPDNLLVLLRGDRAPDFVRQLFTDYASFPYAASPDHECQAKREQMW